MSDKGSERNYVGLNNMGGCGVVKVIWGYLMRG